jgi:hypothetical protein
MKLELAKILESLKRNGKYSPTLLTMFVYSLAGLIYTFADYIQHGYRSEVFFCLILVGTGIKVTDAISKKLTPTIQ